MPTYTYRCPNKHTGTAFRSIAERKNAPKCTQCGELTEQIITATMVRVFTPYRAVAIDKDSGERPLIRTQDEHNAFLRRNGYEEVGNDKSMAPPSREEFNSKRAEKLKELRADPNIIFDFNEETHEATA